MQAFLVLTRLRRRKGLQRSSDPCLWGAHRRVRHHQADQHRLLPKPGATKHDRGPAARLLRARGGQREAFWSSWIFTTRQRRGASRSCGTTTKEGGARKESSLVSKRSARGTSAETGAVRAAGLARASSGTFLPWTSTTSRTERLPGARVALSPTGDWARRDSQPQCFLWTNRYFASSKALPATPRPRSARSRASGVEGCARLWRRP